MAYPQGPHTRSRRRRTTRRRTTLPVALRILARRLCRLSRLTPEVHLPTPPRPRALCPVVTGPVGLTAPPRLHLLGVTLAGTR